MLFLCFEMASMKYLSGCDKIIGEDQMEQNQVSTPT